MSLRGRRTLIAAASVVLLAGGVAAPASAGPSHFKGKTAQKSAVTFTASSKKVSGFKTSLWVLCVSVVTGSSEGEVYPILLQSPTRLKKGKFTMLFTGENGTNITVKGKVTGDTAKGSLAVGYDKIIGYTSTGLLDIAACVADTTWTAKKK